MPPISQFDQNSHTLRQQLCAKIAKVVIIIFSVVAKMFVQRQYARNIKDALDLFNI
jgi:hypothetical protein